VIWDLSDSELRSRLEQRFVSAPVAEEMVRLSRHGDPKAIRLVEEELGYAS
jgi:hypothetical protein